MKNLKKLLAVIVSICVLATFAVPAFAETKTDAQIVTDLGMVQGTTGGVTADYLATTPARYQAAIMFLRLKGLEDEATAFVPTENFDDLQGLNETNKAIVGYLKANPDLGFEGIGGNKFAPLKTITAKEYYKVLLTALGYKEGTDFTWANVFQFAASKGLYALVDNTKFTVNDLAIGTVEALKATVKGGTDTLLAALVEAGAIASDKAVATGFYTAPAKTLEVLSATADTLKTAKFVFSKELDSNTVKKENFTGPAIDGAYLLSDKKTVVVVLATAETEQSKKEDITVKNVKATDGTTVAETKKSVTFVDNTIPVINGITAKNAKAIVINTSEPMDAYNKYTAVFNDIKIDDSKVIVSSSTVDYANNTVTLNLASVLAKGSHKIEVGGLKDFAKYTAATATFNFDIAEDITAPEIVSAKMINTKQIEVTFSEDIDPVFQGSFKVNGNDVTTRTQKDDHAVFTLDFAKALDIAATVEVKVAYKGQRDVVGNEIKDEKTYTFQVKDDTTLPTVTASLDSSNNITLTFSKGMTEAGTLKVLDKDGKQIGTDITLTTSGDDMKWESDHTVAKIDNAYHGIKLDDTDTKDIKLVVKDCKDATIRANGIVETTITLTANDTKKPTVVGEYKYTQGTDNKDDTITITFSEPMNAETLKNLSNYNVVTPGGAGVKYQSKVALSAFDYVSVKEVSSDNKSVVIKGEGIADEKPGLQVYAMKDIAGNMVVTGNTKAFSGDPLVVTKAVATANNKVEITFNQDVKSFSPSTFIIQKSATDTAVTAQIVVGSIDGKVVKATLDRDIGTKTTNAYLKILDKAGTKNTFDADLSTASGILASGVCQLTDGIKPTVKDITTTTGAIIVTFSENISSTADGFAKEVYLTNDDGPVIVTGASITVGVDNIKISGLDNTKTYTIQLLPKGETTDGTNWFVAPEIKKDLQVK